MSPKTALCLAGGGAMGAMFQIGALAALEDAVEGLEVNAFDLYIGSASGANVAASLAAGLPVQRIYRAFLDPADVYFGLERRHLLRMDLGEWRRMLVSAASALKHGASSWLSRDSTAQPKALFEEFDRLYDSMPAGLFTLEVYERFLEEFFLRRGVSNSFQAMPRPLLIMAHDLDSGEVALFGANGTANVPVARACIASMAIPPFFSPVRIGERHYINPGAGQVAHLDVAVEQGAELIVVVNPMVPVRVDRVPTGHGHKESLRDKGMMWVLNQALRIGMGRLVRESCERVAASGKAKVVLIEPAPEDGIMFMYNPASFDARRRLLEYSYKHTRSLVQSAFQTSGSAFERAGWNAKAGV